METLAAETMSCPGCNHTIVHRSRLGSHSLICGSCLSLIDVSDPDMVMIEMSHLRQAESSIPLGSVAHFGDDVFRLIGYLKVADNNEEYLLESETLGYRRLCYVDGHWSLFRPVEPSLETPNRIDNGEVEFRGQHYKFFRKGRLRPQRAQGEFNWRLRLTEPTNFREYVCPPFNLRLEKRDSAEQWSIGKYLSAREVTRAFKMVRTLPPPQGIAPHEPSPFTKFLRECASIFAIFSLALLTTQISSTIDAERTVQESKLHLTASDGPQSTEPFQIRNGPQPVRIQFDTRLANHARLGANISLSEIGQKRQFAFYKEIGHFDDGPADEVFLSKVPEGNYVLTVTEAPGNRADAVVRVKIKSGQRPWSNFFLAFGLILLPLILAFAFHLSFESRRAGGV